MIQSNKNYQQLIQRISETYADGQQKAVQAVNTHLLETYWQIGQYIVEFEQGGEIKAEYGKALLENLSKDLGSLHGKGFSRSNLVYMRLFYLKYPISEKPSHQLSWLLWMTTSKDNQGIMKLSKERQIVKKTTNLLREPYVLEIFIPELCHLCKSKPMVTKTYNI